jgi:hypothetical protein
MRVLSVPSGHVYVRHLSSRTPDGVVRLDDPPARGRMRASQWWPPPALDPSWVAGHVDDFDVFHLHFGFDDRTPEQLAELTALLRQHGKPSVYTVHDLRNPHHADRRVHDAQLDALVPEVDELITLTHGAATRIGEKWGREATVLPHPHVVEEPTLRRARPERREFVVGVHVKSLRASMDPLPVIEALAKRIQELPDARLRVDVHNDVMRPELPRYDPDLAWRLRAMDDAGLLSLFVHDFFSDDELWFYLQNLDLSVLPYRFGTHSGWLEACYDLGTPVLVGNCGFYAEQAPCLTYDFNEEHLDEDSLEQGLLSAYRERPGWRADPHERRLQRERIAAAHRDLYLRLVRS